MKLFLYLCVLVLSNCCFLLEADSKIDSSVPFTYPKDRQEFPEGRIIGGQEVTPNSYPFQAALYINFNNGSRIFCGGSLISTEWVLTAAHCLDDAELAFVLVYLGSHNVRESTEPTRVVLNTTEVVYHPSWANNFRDDIGLVKLPINVTLNENIGLVEFAKDNDLYVDRIGTMLGWGITETSGNSISPVLKRVNSTIMTNEECKNRPSYNQVIVPTHICVSGVGPVGTCNGDSGGPLVVDGIQVGITAFGTTNCSLQYPSVFTRITEYVDWIALYVRDGGDTYNSFHYSIVVSGVLCMYQLFSYM